MKGLTAVFGMGTGVPPSLETPRQKDRSKQWAYPARFYPEIHRSGIEGCMAHEQYS